LLIKPSTNLKNLILVDDHVIIRNGLKALIEKLGSFKIIEEFSNGAELLKDRSVFNNADLIIMDLAMPVMNAEETLQQMNESGIKIPVLILTLNQDDSKVIKLFRLGVRGYLQKTCTATTMSEAIHEIFRCGYYHNEFLTASLTSTVKKDDKAEILEKLTPREMEFLRYVCHENEYTYEQIAGLMNVQPRTIDGYRESLFEKFSIKSKTGLVLFVLRNRLFDHF
jgi:two-component system, NarL family, invasion response regulator UvrY